MLLASFALPHAASESPDCETTETSAAASISDSSVLDPGGAAILGASLVVRRKEVKNPSYSQFIQNIGRVSQLGVTACLS